MPALRCLGPSASCPTQAWHQPQVPKTLAPLIWDLAPPITKPALPQALPGSSPLHPDLQELYTSWTPQQVPQDPKSLIIRPYLAPGPCNL